jgi:hypothetical protein
MNPNLKADVAFLRRVLLTLVFATTFAGAMVGVTAVHAMNQAAGANPSDCLLFCSR